MNFLEHGIEKKELVPRVPKFSEIILAATFASNRHLNPEIKQIDLGSLAYEAQLLRDKTANDPKHREVGKQILIKNDNFPKIGQYRLIIEREARLGQTGVIDSEVNIRVVLDIHKRRNILKQQRQDKFRITTIHAHDTEKPPSPEDIARILLDDIENPGASTCVFVTSKDTNYLVFRGQETPLLKQKDISSLKQAWEGKIQKAWQRKIKEVPLLKFGKVIVKEILTKSFGKMYTHLPLIYNCKI